MEDDQNAETETKEIKIEGGSSDFQNWAKHTLDHLKPSPSYLDAQQHGTNLTDDDIKNNTRIDAIRDINSMLKTGVPEKEIKEIYMSEVLEEELVK